MLTSPERTLATALNFDMTDLTHNREGEVSARQQARLQAARNEENKDFVFGMTFIVLPGLFGCGACAFLFDIPVIIGSVDYLTEAIGLLVGVVAVGVVWSAWQGRKANRGVSDGIAAAVTGPLTLTSDETRQRPRFYIVIGEDRFRVPWRIYEALQMYEGIGQAHTLYYVPGMRYVLSIEAR